MFTIFFSLIQGTLSEVPGLLLLSYDSFATPWTVAHQAPQSGPWDFPDKNTGVGCHFLFQGIFLTQGWKLSPALQADFFFFFFKSLSHQGRPFLG